MFRRFFFFSFWVLGGISGYGGFRIRGVVVFCFYDLGIIVVFRSGFRRGRRVVGVFLVFNYYYYRGVSRICILVGEEFSWVSELSVVFGIDLGVIFFVSIIWGEDKERAWVARLGWLYRGFN